MKRLLLAVPLALAGPLGAVAQDPPSTPWVETRFHRVHLRNGNFIDGQLVQQNAKGVVLQMSRNGDFVVRKDLIQRVEYIKMRSLKEIPKVPEVESAPESELATASKTPAIKTPQPESIKTPAALPGGAFRPETVRTVDAILTTWALARSDMRRDIAPQLRAAGPEAIAYACWIAQNGRAGIEVPPLIEALGQIDSPDVLQALLNVVASGRDSFDRGAAVKALAPKDNPQARAAVHRALGDSSPQVYRVAQEEILKLHAKGQADVEAIIALLENGDEKGVVSSTLGKMGGEVEMAALRDLLGRGSAVEKAAALRGLGKAGRKEDGALALPLLEDPEAKTRRDATRFLGQVKYEPAVRPLIDTLKDEDAETVSNAYNALREITGLKLPNIAQRWEEWWIQTGKAKFEAEAK